MKETEDCDGVKSRRKEKRERRREEGRGRRKEEVNI